MGVWKTVTQGMYRALRWDLRMFLNDNTELEY